jgi:Replication initiator protein A
MTIDPETPFALAASITEPVEVIQLGKDEMNLAEFPITLLTDRVPKGKNVIQYQDRIFDEKSGKHISRKLTINASESIGLPTAVDDDVILGLIQLTKMVNNFTSREVEFSRLDFIKLLGWPDSGDSYRRLSVSLKRWLSVTLLYENAWRDNKQGAWTTKGFHILDNIELNDGRTAAVQGELFPSKIIWNKVVYESFKAGYLKSIDYGLYLQLRHTIARRMYRFLSKRMYFGPELTFDLFDLAFAHIGLSDTYRSNAAKVKEKLQPAIDELEQAGFLEPMSKEERYRKEGKNWQIRLFCRIPSPALPSAADDAEPVLPPLAAELTKRGVTQAVAVELVQRHPAEFVQLKLEEFDWLVKNQDKRVGKNPAGYLVSSIRSDYQAPPEFTAAEAKTKAAGKAAERARQVVEDDRKQRRKAKDEADRSKAREAMLRERWERLPEADRAAIVAAVKAENPSIGRFKTMLEPLCLAALEKRLASGGQGHQKGLFPDLD